jgi:hypothetical protein
MDAGQSPDAATMDTRPRLGPALVGAVAAITAFLALSPPSADAAVSCDMTQSSGESVSAFLNRLGPNRDGCLIAGTHTIGNLTNFKPGQRIHPAPEPGGGYQRVTLRGTMSLNADNVVLDDLFIEGVQNSQNVKIIEVGNCNNCRLDHLDITSNPHYVDFQGILNYAATTGLQITNNKIHHVGGDGQFDHGIYCHHPMNAGVIEGNWIYANASFGIQFYPDCDGVTFAHNVLDDNGALADPGSGSSTSGCGSVGRPSCAGSATNGRGLIFGGEGSQHADNVNVRNNVLSSFGGAGRPLVACYLPGQADWIRDTLLYQASGSDDSCGSSISRSNIVRANPLYVDRANHDYRLRANSPGRALMGSYADAVPGPRLDSGEPAPAPAPAPPPDPAPAPDPDPAPAPVPEPAPAPAPAPPPSHGGTRPAPVSKPRPHSSPRPATTEPRPRRVRAPRRRARLSLTIAPNIAGALERGRLLRLTGRVARRYARRARRVRIQVATAQGWRTVAVARVARGRVFALRWRLSAPRKARRVLLRAVIPHVGRSRAKQVLLAG